MRLKACVSTIANNRKKVNDMNRENYAPRMRTLPEAERMLRELDESSAITLTALRRMVSEGRLPVTKIGSKRLINFDALLRILECPPEDKPCDSRVNNIRKIAEWK